MFIARGLQKASRTDEAPYLQEPAANTLGVHPTCVTVAARGRRGKFYIAVGKRVLDVSVALLGLAITSPLLVICAIAIRLDSPGPIVLRQIRVGQQGRHFRILKLRTMVHDPEKFGLQVTASGDSRITAVGKWLRKFKFDEIPQLLNVLKGEMSLVGPRPELPSWVAIYNDKQKRVFEMRPGCTSPAALAFIDEEKMLAAAPDKESFYANLVMPRKLDLDLAYGDSISFATDLRLLLITAGRLFHVR